MVIIVTEACMYAVANQWNECLPDQHLFYYTQLQEPKCPRCPQCPKRYDPYRSKPRI